MVGKYSNRYKQGNRKHIQGVVEALPRKKRKQHPDVVSDVFQYTYYVGSSKNFVREVYESLKEV